MRDVSSLGSLVPVCLKNVECIASMFFPGIRRRFLTFFNAYVGSLVELVDLSVYVG